MYYNIIAVQSPNTPGALGMAKWVKRAYKLYKAIIQYNDVLVRRRNVEIDGQNDVMNQLNDEQKELLVFI